VLKCSTKRKRELRQKNNKNGYLLNIVVRGGNSMTRPDKREKLVGRRIELGEGREEGKNDRLQKKKTTKKGRGQGIARISMTL